LNQSTDRDLVYIFYTKPDNSKNFNSTLLIQFLFYRLFLEIKSL